jgi:hypothetical protein
VGTYHEWGLLTVIKVDLSAGVMPAASLFCPMAVTKQLGLLLWLFRGGVVDDAEW